MLEPVWGRLAAVLACCTRWNDIRSDTCLSFSTPPRLADSVGRPAPGQRTLHGPLPACLLLCAYTVALELKKASGGLGFVLIVWG